MTKLWTNEETKRLHSIVAKHGGPSISAFRKASVKLNRPIGSCERRYSRTPNVTIIDPTNSTWTETDTIKLYDMKVRLKMTYAQIASSLNRTPIACERQFQRADWDSLIGNSKSIDAAMSKAEEVDLATAESIREEASEKHAKFVVNWLVNSVKFDHDKLLEMDKDTFELKLDGVFNFPDAKLKREDVTMSFEEIKRMALNEIDRMGGAYQKYAEFGEGTYVIVGDSHGKHTRSEMFDMLKTLDKTLGVDKIIHVGHIFDDEDEISFLWKNRFADKLVVIGVQSELSLLKSQKHQYEVVRKAVKLGNKVVVTNQYDVGDFVKKSIGRIDTRTLPTVSIVNAHRHELHTHCAYGDRRIVASPGCVCEKHVIRTDKILMFKDGYPTVRKTYPFGFKKYNKQEQDYERWEQGVIVVEVDKNGFASFSHCRVRKTSLGYTTSFFNVIIGSEGISIPEKKIFFNGDMHSIMHDPQTLDIQEQFCDQYKPDTHVNVGDLVDNRSVNHHMGGTSGPAFFMKKDEVVYRNLLPEIAVSRYIVQRMRRWAKESHLIIGNHERFAADFVLKHPQFKEMLSTEFILGTSEMDIKTTPLKKTLDFGTVRFIHGDIKIWGGFGSSKVDKVANNYDDNIVMGNIHYPCIRAGCYSVGMSGLLDQDYNETDASQWLQGFGYANMFEDQCFVSLVNIIDHKCRIAGRTYVPRDCSSWEMPQFEASLSIAFRQVPEKVSAPIPPLVSSSVDRKRKQKPSCRNKRRENKKNSMVAKAKKPSR